MSKLITLKCLKVAGRLRVRIITSGYKNDSNCQFPRNIRKEGLTYTTLTTDVKLAKGPKGKYFYRIGKNNIKIISNYTKMKIYEDKDSKECIICMDEDKTMVFAPCGHYCACKKCCENVINIIGTCPLCRGQVIDIVNISQIG